MPEGLRWMVFFGRPTAVVLLQCLASLPQYDCRSEALTEDCLSGTLLNRRQRSGTSMDRRIKVGNFDGPAYP